MRSSMKKRLAAVAVGTAMATSAGVAFAYWTSTGSGDGTAATNHSTEVTLTGISVSDLAPGVTKSVPFSFVNTDGNGNQNFGKAHVEPVADGDITSADSAHPCTAAMLDLAYNEGGAAVGTVGNGDTYNSDSTTEPSLKMQELGSSQDLCQDASVAITVKLAQGS